MAIRRLRVENFKSFKELDLELGNFHIVIGPNAAGKSNLVQIFRFLRDCGQQGLDNAVSLQGGFEYLRTLEEPEAAPLGPRPKLVCETTLELLLRLGPFRSKREGSAFTGLKVSRAHYSFTLASTENPPGYRVVEETATLEAETVRLEPDETRERTGRLVERGSSGRGTIIMRRTDSGVNAAVASELDLPGELLTELGAYQEIRPSALLLERGPLPLFMPPLYALVGGIALYDFDPKLPKASIPVAGKAWLEEDGRNLAIVLKDILDDPKRNRKLSNLLQDILGFVHGLDVQRLADKSLFFRLAERYAPQIYLPASLISDGTINVIALLLALHFEPSQMTVIEEPERNIHPSLIRRLVEEMREVSKRKQVIITTHNPEIVRHARLEELLLVTRDAQGLSRVTRPAGDASVKLFLEQEMGLEEIFVQNLLGLGS